MWACPLIGVTAAELLVRRIGQIDAPSDIVLLPATPAIRDTTVPPALRQRRNCRTLV
jgi:LacI family transcriptional regulator